MCFTDVTPVTRSSNSAAGLSPSLSKAAGREQGTGFQADVIRLLSREEVAVKPVVSNATNAP
jgi:hypothetical protein